MRAFCFDSSLLLLHLGIFHGNSRGSALCRGRSTGLPAAVQPQYVNRHLCIVYENNPSEGEFYTVRARLRAR